MFSLAAGAAARVWVLDRRDTGYNEQNRNHNSKGFTETFDSCRKEVCGYWLECGAVVACCECTVDSGVK